MFRDFPTLLGAEHDSEARVFLFLADMYELLLVRALSDLGRDVANLHALEIASRWYLPLPGWAADRLRAAVEGLWEGRALPSPEAGRKYHRDLDRLRAAADVYDRKREAERTVNPADKPSLSGVWRRWAHALGASPETVRGWGARLDPVLERLRDPGVIAEWESYVTRAAKALGIDLDTE